MKGLKYFIFLVMFLAFSIQKVSASTVTIHYSGTSRLPTYTWANTYVGNIHNVVGYNDSGNANVESQLNNSVMFVAHNHGDPGKQYLSSSTGIVGTNGDNTNWKSVSSMTLNTSKPLYIAIYYGCQTGKTTSSYGNIMAQTTAKKAKSAVAWTVNTYVNDVNLWNKYFFFKAKTFTTGAVALTYADTQLAADSGAINASIMKNKRVTSGLFNWQFGTMVQSNNLNNIQMNVNKIVNSKPITKTIHFLDFGKRNLKFESSYRNSFNETVSIYSDINLNEYLFINDSLVGYINNNYNVDNYHFKEVNISKKVDVALDYVTKLLKNETNINNYELISSEYLDGTDEYSFVFVRRNGEYLTNDGIIISINSNNELISYVAAQQGIFEQYKDVKIDQKDVKEFVDNYMINRMDDIADYSIDKQYLNIVDGQLVLQIGLELVHSDGHFSTDILYYMIKK